MRSGLAVRLGAEALGTIFLVYFGCAAVVAGLGGLLGVALAFAVAIAAGVWILGPVSGGHFNPWATLSIALRGLIGWTEAAMYVAAQLVGAFLGALVLWASYGKQGVSQLLGATHLAAGADTGRGLVGALLAEAVATFLFVCVVAALTSGDRAGDRMNGLGIGLAIGVGVLAIGVLTGASMNFARTFGPELALTLAGGATDWGHIWVYLVGPAIGAVAGAYAYDAFTATAAPATTRARKG